MWLWGDWGYNKGWRGRRWVGGAQLCLVIMNSKSGRRLEEWPSFPSWLDTACSSSVGSNLRIWLQLQLCFLCCCPCCCCCCCCSSQDADGQFAELHVANVFSQRRGWILSPLQLEPACSHHFVLQTQLGAGVPVPPPDLLLYLSQHQPPCICLLDHSDCVLCSPAVGEQLISCSAQKFFFGRICRWFLPWSEIIVGHLTWTYLFVSSGVVNTSPSSYKSLLSTFLYQHFLLEPFTNKIDWQFFPRSLNSNLSSRLDCNTFEALKS